MRQRFLFLTVALALVGCQHRDQQAVPGLTTNTPSKTVKVALIMGQSNAVRFNPAGYDGVQVADPNALWNFINCASNGTDINAWRPGGALYANCSQMVSGRPIDLVFYYQGEADAKDGGSYDTWAQKFTVIARQLKVNYPGAKIVYAQLSDDNHLDEYPHWKEVQYQQNSVSVPGVEMVRTVGLPKESDNLHLTSDAEKTLGELIRGVL